MEAKAVAKYIRIAPRKVRVVMDLIRGKSVAEAFAILKFTPKAGADVITKVLKSAVANAENNFDMNVDNLYVSTAYVDQGPTLKRIHPPIFSKPSKAPSARAAIKASPSGASTGFSGV